MREIQPVPAHVQQHVDLQALASKINAACDAADASVMAESRSRHEKHEQRRAAGHALIKAQEACQRDGIPWLTWLAANVRRGERTVYRLMTFVRFDHVNSAEDEDDAWRRICGHAPAIESGDSIEPEGDESKVDAASNASPSTSAEPKKDAPSFDASRAAQAVGRYLEQHFRKLWPQTPQERAGFAAALRRTADLIEGEG